MVCRQVMSSLGRHAIFVADAQAYVGKSACICRVSQYIEDQAGRRLPPLNVAVVITAGNQQILVPQNTHDFGSRSLLQHRFKDQQQSILNFAIGRLHHFPRRRSFPSRR